MKEEENNNVMSRYDHKIETSLEGIEHLSKEYHDSRATRLWDKTSRSTRRLAG